MKFHDRLLRIVPAVLKRRRAANIKVGDMVTVLPYEQILTTLDENNCHEGLVFMPNMKRFCNKQYRVLKQVNWIYDEKNRKMASCDDLVALEGLVCDGKGMLAGKDCDRCCTLLWKTIWLENGDDDP